MALPPGTRLGPYEILSPLGSGGMGDVYRARDTRLQRTVAIKVLPPHVLSDPALRTRFEREARTISSLDHPNICVLHDVGREGDLEYLVMQHLDGETLAARLARGPLPFAEALRFGIDIASALDQAHRAGVLHRDIKPGNVMLVKSGGVSSAKLLDFGLAKSVATDDVASVSDAQATATSPLTGRGVILGTLLYMSPEQLEGRDVDARSDIFSFGAMLYEMITGRRAFDGSSQASIIGAILERDPAPMASVAPLTPPALDRLVRKCLAKDRDRRWQSAGDLCDELTWIAQSPDVQPQPSSVPDRRRWLPVLLATAALLLVGAIAAVIASVLLREKTPPDAVARDLEISLPANLRLAPGGIAISPDGKTIVFSAWAGNPPPEVTAPTRSGETKRLFLRRFDRSDVTPLAGTDGARAPFFSPDGEWIGFFTSRALHKLSLRGGAPVRIGGTPPVTRGGVWLPDNSIVVSPTQSTGLIRFPPDGPPALFTHPEPKDGQKAHLWPQLVGGTDLLYTIRRGTTTDVDDSDIGILNAASGEHRVLLKGAAFGQYSPTGHLLFVRSGTLSAVPFDPLKKQVSGTPVPVASGIAVNPWLGGAHYAVSSDGALVLWKGSFPEDRSASMWVERTGKSSPAAGIDARRGLPGQPRIAPDGTRAMFDAPSADGDDEVFLVDLRSGTAVRLSNDPGDDFDAVWTPDGKRAVWTSLPAGRLPFLVMRAIDGSGRTEEVTGAQTTAQFAGSISPSNVLAYTLAKQDGQSDIWIVPLDGERKTTEFIASPAVEYGPEFSPDGKWIAYVSNESGALEVYVVPYPGPGGKRRVSMNGGVSPAWSRDGSELFYQSDDGLLAVAVKASPDGLSFGTPRKLFGPTYAVDSREDGPRGYDVDRGGRFLMFLPQPAAPAPLSFHVLLNWTSTLKPAR